MAEDADRLREWLAERDEACPSCGYNLRGLAGQACPECGLGLTLRVGLTEPATGTLIATIVGLLVGLSGSGLFAVILFIGLVRFSYLKADVGSIGCIFTLAVTGVSIGFLTSRRGRAWFCRRSKDLRAGIAIAAWSFSVLACLVVVIATLGR